MSSCPPVQYNLFLQDSKRFLLAACKRKKPGGSNYLVSLDYDDLDRDSASYFGKLRANFVGTEFTIYDSKDKRNKKDKKDKKDRDEDSVRGRSVDGMDGDDRQELGCVTYQYNVLGTRGPRKMTGIIPALDGQGRNLFQPISNDDSMLER